MSFGRCWIGFVRPPWPLPWTEPSDCITSVEDWIALGGATWPLPALRAFPAPFTVDVPGGQRSGGWLVNGAPGGLSGYGPGEG